MKKVTIIFITQWLMGALLWVNTEIVHAQNEGRWYNIEVLIFKRLGASSSGKENWPNNVALDYPPIYQYLLSGSNRNFGLQPQTSHQLGGFNYTLRRNENYEVLFHRAWRQQVLGEEQSPSIVVNGGDSVGGRKELEGHLKIHVARYLHLESDLWLTRLPQPDAEAIWPKLPARPGTRTSADSPDTSVQKIIGNDGHSFLGDKRIFPVATMKTKRRMRSNELHYVDHPLMGIFIVITPIED